MFKPATCLFITQLEKKNFVFLKSNYEAFFEFRLLSTLIAVFVVG